MGYISALTYYYLLLIITATLSSCEGNIPAFRSAELTIDSVATPEEYKATRRVELTCLGLVTYRDQGLF